MTSTMRRKTSAAYRKLSLSPATLSAYQSDLRRYRAAGGRIPSTSQALASYLARQAEVLRPSTIRRRLAAISYEHTRRGLRSPTRSPVVQQTLRGIRRAAGANCRQAKPLSVQVLRAIAKDRRGQLQIRNKRDRALLLLGFSAGFRRSELASLRAGDVSFTRNGLLVRLRKSKTDPYSVGREVAVPYGREVGCCPVRSLKTWIAQYSSALTSAMTSDTPLFARIDRYGHVFPGLTGASVGAILKARLVLAGISPDGYSAHSLRAGLVTSAARAGAPLWAIQRQTGHRSASSVHRYIRDVPPFEMNPVRSLL